MGTDKALLVVDGSRLVDRALRALRDAQIAHLYISGHQTATFAQDVVVVPDAHDDQGPLGGIVSTWTHIVSSEATPSPAGLVVLSCDLPQVSASLVTRLLEAATGDHDGALAHDGHRAQPLVAFYRPSALAGMQVAWNDGERSVRRLFGQWSLVEVDSPQQSVDADSPDDLTRHSVEWPVGHENGSAQ